MSRSTSCERRRRSGGMGGPAGTTRIASFADPSLFQNGPDAAVTGGGGGLLLFAGEDAAHGTELWRSAGTRAGTRLLKDIAPEDIGGSGPSDMSAAGARLFFFANDGVHGDALWTSDGTAAGTSLASTFGLAPGTVIAPPGGLGPTAAVGETLFFGIALSENSPALWASDGTAAGTRRLTADGVSMGFPTEIAAVGATVFFTADDGVHGSALWKSDGTPAGTLPVDPVAWAGGGAQGLTPFQGQLFFFLEGSDGGQLWRSDGTPTGTVHVADLNAPLGDDNLPLLIELGGRLYFFAQDAPGIAGSQRLWATDGTTAGTGQVSSLGLAPEAAFYQQQLAVAGSRLFIFGSSGAWVSDGTDGGTSPLPNVSGVGDTVDFGGRLAFTARLADPTSPTVLWLSDGTASGTAPLLDAGGHQIAAATLSSFGGHLVYEAAGTGGLVLWQSDGTPSGAAPVLTVWPLTSYFVPQLGVAGDRLYLNAYDPATGDELWALRP